MSLCLAGKEKTYYGVTDRILRQEVNQDRCATEAKVKEV